jgi:hypothetical protein
MILSLGLLLVFFCHSVCGMWLARLKTMSVNIPGHMECRFITNKFVTRIHVPVDLNISKNVTSCGSGAVARSNSSYLQLFNLMNSQNFVQCRLRNAKQSIVQLAFLL